MYAVILRHIFLFKHSFDRLSDVFYWPTLDLVLWGITSAVITQNAPNIPNLMLIILSGVMLWIITWRSQYEISVGLLEELWNKNLLNLFVAPLKFSEWVFSLLILGIMKALISFVFASVVAFLLYATNIYHHGFYLLPFIVLLTISGWWIGFIVAGLIFRYGTRIQTLAWTLVWALAPFSALYFPVSALPEWAQSIAVFVPMSYIFEGAREVIATGSLDPQKLLMSFLLNIVYLGAALYFVWKSFRKVLQKGLIKVI
jgi:ABC-2 type transport system permease protein